MTAVLDRKEFDDLTRRQFGQLPQCFRHTLHQREMFGDAALADVLDRYPRDRLGIFTMGSDPVDWRSWRRGCAGDLPGAELLDAVRQGRIWLNLRAANLHLEDYDALSGEMFGALQDLVPGLKTFRRDVGLLISSPRAHVFYHLDIPRVTLWHLRGDKRVWVYPARQPFIGDEALERIVLKESAEQFDYDPGFDRQAAVFDLKPGDMLHWPQNGPHRIVNGDTMNVSLSCEFMTPGALIRANALYADGLMRRRWGRTPKRRPDAHPASLAKFVFARVAKAVGLKPAPPDPLPPSFQVDPGAPESVGPLSV